jgi:hypothetical protein
MLRFIFNAIMTVVVAAAGFLLVSVSCCDVWSGVPALRRADEESIDAERVGEERE